MKKIKHQPWHRPLAILAAGVILGGMFGMSSRADIYRSATNNPGGISAQFTITNTPVATNTALSKLSWYGPHAWYTIQGASSAVGPFSDLVVVAATNHSTSVTISNLGNSYFRAKQWNGFAGGGACAGCHGDKYDTYSETLHAAAYTIFNSSGAFPITSLTVGADQTNAGGFVDTSTTPHLLNVSCENCHGPASWHKTSDHSLIKPAVSLDPLICGGCHTGPVIPQYDEWKTSAHANKSRSSSTGCGVCHQANTRMAMINEYYDNLAGNGHALNLPATTSIDRTNWTATCATCHDPHGINKYVSTLVVNNSGVLVTNLVTNAISAQLRYRLTSTNFYDMPTFIDTRSGVTYNTTFDSLYNPDVQVCAQCHNARGARWDGNTYGLVTNSVAVPARTNVVAVDIYTNIVTTNIFGSITNYLTNSYVIGRSNSTVITAATTNQVVSVSNVTSYVTYNVTNAGIVTTYVATDTDGNPCTNSSGYARAPHHSPQYNILIGILNKDYFSTNSSGVATNVTQRHTFAPKQCASCHVPSYAMNGTNISGHSFKLDTKGCALAGCHTSYTEEALELKIEDRQIITSNAVLRIASLLNQWAAKVSPDILRTNYGSMAWDYNTEPEWGLTNSLSKVGPPSAFSWRTNWTIASGTNDNLQLKYLPEDIRRARFNLYMVTRDGSWGVHNPSFVPALLNDAETRVLNQLKAATNYQGVATNFLAMFSANTTLTYVGTNVVFTNSSTGATAGSWDFGDTTTTNVLNPVHAYSAPGLYAVTYTDGSGQSLTRTRYIQVRDYPAIQFVGDTLLGQVPLTVTFTNTSTSGLGDVEWWRWQFNTSDSNTRLDAPGTDPVSFTYTNGGVYSVLLRANMSGASSISKTNASYVRVVGANFSATPTNGVAPLTVTFTNTSGGATNYLWDFGDGNTSGGTNVSNIYSNAGNYTVTLAASYAGVTNVMTRTNYITVTAP